MAFTDTQIRQLKAKLDPRHIKTRNANGAELSYVEGWHLIAEANRIFGYDAWDRRTIFTSCVSTAVKAGSHQATYIAKVRITVRAGEMNVIREGSGAGEATSATPGQAHELALKTAETDATKRALATFGNPFGLPLYDPDQVGVKKLSTVTGPASGPWILRSATGATAATYGTDTSLIEALKQAMSEVDDIERLYDLWEQNIETLRAIHRSPKSSSYVIPQMVAHLRACAVALVKGHSDRTELSPKKENKSPQGGRQKIDKSVLTISEPRRVRSKDHLRYVASQPCLICGRAPSHAHHVRYAQSRGMSIKVSDEFTVPLCATHHHHIHTTLKEREWWQKQGIDPLKAAAQLWEKTHTVETRENPSATGNLRHIDESGVDPTSTNQKGNTEIDKPSIPGSS